MKKVFRWMFIIIAAILYCVFLWLRVSKMPMNSDGATMLLYAEDVLSGNFFLSDWHLTGLTFATTDLPFFVVGTALAGVGLKAFHISVTLMYLFMVFAALMLSLYAKKHKWLTAAAIAAVGLFPTNYALSNAFVHTAVFALVFLAVLFAKVYKQKASRLSLIAFAVVTALAVCGDKIAIVMISLPMLLLCAFGGFGKTLKPVIATVFGTIAGLFMEKLYLVAGGADINSLQQSSFIDLHSLWEKVFVYIEYFLRLINAYFFGKNIFSVKTLFFAVKIFIVGFAVYLIYKAIKKLVLREDSDVVTAMLGMGFLFMTVLLFITTINTNITAGRYIGFVPIMLGVILSQFTEKISDLFQKKHFVLMIGFCGVLALTGIVPSGSAFSPYNTYSELADFLEAHNLEHGIANFWDASVITAYSENAVKVRPVEWKDNALKARIWFCKNQWYEEPVEFVIIRNGGDVQADENYMYNGIYHMRLNAGPMFGVNRENTVEFMGEPSEILTFKNYWIYLYNQRYL